MREGLTFSAVWASLPEALEMTAAELTADTALTAKMLSRFNKEYKRAYDLRTWEDAWEDGALTPADLALVWSEVEDSRHFELWSADPRAVTSAVECAYSTTRDGITLHYDYSTVHGFWKPMVRPFTLTAYNAGTAYTLTNVVLASDGHNYVCIQAGTGQTPQSSPTYWRQQPVLSILAEDVIDLAAGLKFIREGNYGTGNALRQDAKASLDRAASQEFARLARQNGRAWRPATLPV